MSESAGDLLAEDLASFYDDPYGFVLWAFPWGEEGSVLQDFEGPRDWQKEFLINWGKEIKKRGFNGVDPVAPIQDSTSSGHGIGKSALSAWIIIFISSTRPFSKGVVTSNTATQLKTKTWGELGKWLKLSLIVDMFDFNSSKGNMNLISKSNPDDWRVDAFTAKQENSESFAGLHAATSTPFYLFDEASAIPENIFEVAQGGLTDGEPMFFMFGNPTRNTGFFFKTFNSLAHRWKSRRIDSRDVKGTNKELMNEWIEDHGLDSDFVKVRVRGLHPSSSICQLIPTDLVQEAMGKQLKKEQYVFAPVVLGVDVAWYGDDRSCIWLRQGLRSELLWQGREVDSTTGATLIAQFEDKYDVDATFIDPAIGSGWIDNLRRMGRNPTPIYFGGKSTRKDCLNKRASMWQNLKEWLEVGGILPNDQDVSDDLTSPEYGRDNPKGQIQLESKKSMKKRGLKSPDLADGLSLTFAQPVVKRSKMSKHQNKQGNVMDTSYDPFN